MAGSKQPLAVVVANGKKHLTKAEIEVRELSEVKAPVPKQVRAPKYLSKPLCKKFNELSRQLIELGIFSKLDADALARYLIAEQGYIDASENAAAALSGKDSEVDVDAVKDWSMIQERYFKQCRNSASDLGLTITSRCRLVIPQKEDNRDFDDPLIQLLERCDV